MQEKTAHDLWLENMSAFEKQYNDIRNGGGKGFYAFYQQKVFYSATTRDKVAKYVQGVLTNPEERSAVFIERIG